MGIVLCGLVGWAGQQQSQQRAPSGNAGPPAPAKFFPVKPVTSRQPIPSPGSVASLGIGNARFFSYALPQGWRVGEDGQFALTLMAPDNKAFTVMVGNAGLPPNYPPGRYVQEKFLAMQPQNLQVGPPGQASPVAGFKYAFEFDVAYVSARGVPIRGLAKCNIKTAYDSAVFAMTAAVADAGQWPGYAGWLPQVADQISATNGAAFGIQGLMAQNLRNSAAFGEAARNYREWSQRNWQQVTDQRDASQGRRNDGVREVLGAAQPYSHPFGENRNVELPLTYRYYWMDRQGNVVGTDEPSANPNQGSTSEWRQMKRTN
jgi:hypothetical protein